MQGEGDRSNEREFAEKGSSGSRPASKPSKKPNKDINGASVERAQSPSSTTSSHQDSQDIAPLKAFASGKLGKPDMAGNPAKAILGVDAKSRVARHYLQEYGRTHDTEFWKGMKIIFDKSPSSIQWDVDAFVQEVGKSRDSGLERIRHVLKKGYSSCTFLSGCLLPAA